jgi:tetratricopeptide (TPR) repeat protein
MRRVRRLLARLVFPALVLLAATGVWDWWQHTTAPEYRLRRGQEALRKGDAESAKRMAARLEASGHRDHARMLRGEAALRRGDLTRAIDEFNRIRDRGELLVEVSAVYGQWFLLQLKMPAEAERFLRFVASKKPDHIDARRGLATIYYDQRAWAAAVGHLVAWGELDPADGRPYRFIGLIYREMDQPKPAIPAYREALRRTLQPHVAEEVRQELAECLTAQSDYAEALEVLGGAGSTADDPRAVAVRAECLWGLRRGREASDLLDAALTRNPGEPDLLRLRARVHLADQKPQPAADLLERVLRDHPHDHTSRYQLSQAYEALGRSADAAEQRKLVEKTQAQLKRLTDLVHEAGDKPWDASLRLRAAQLCRELGRPDLAASWMRAAASCPPAPQDPSAPPAAPTPTPG